MSERIPTLFPPSYHEGLINGGGGEIIAVRVKKDRRRQPARKSKGFPAFPANNHTRDHWGKRREDSS